MLLDRLTSHPRYEVELRTANTSDEDYMNEE